MERIREIFEFFTNEQEIAALQDAQKRRNIEVVLFDCDNTILKTDDVYQKAYEEMYNLITHANGHISPQAVSREEGVSGFKKNLSAVFSTLRGEFHVNPAMFHIIIQEIARQYGIKRESILIEQLLDRFERINTVDRYSPYPGVHETVKSFAKTSEQTYVMTHAYLDNARRKLGTAGLLSSFTGIVAMDVGLSKAEQWDGQLQRLGINPRQSLVIGDSFDEDILPTVKLGATAIWLTLNRPVTEEQQTMIRQINGCGSNLLQTDFIYNAIPTLIQSS